MLYELLIGEKLYEVAEKNKFWNKPEIESAYNFAKSSPIEISLKRESGLIERDGLFYSGMTDPNDTEKLSSALVSFSAGGARGFGDEYGIIFQEATARILTHEFNAHIKNFFLQSDCEIFSYDWRGMPVEFVRQDVCENVKCASTRLTLDYDGSGRRISKTVWRKAAGESGWTKDNITHYTGIGTEVRENFAGSTPGAKVVVSLPEGLGRYALGDASENADAKPLKDVNGNELAGMLPGTNFEWFLKNHLGSTMLVFGTQSSASPDASDNGTLKAAYDYHATVVATRTKQQVTKCCPPFGEQLTLVEPIDKVTENFTGKGIRGERCDSRVYSNWHCRAEEHCAQRNEKDDEIELNYFGARYLDPMLGLWTSVDPARQFASPYLYAGNGMNPMNGVDPSGSFYDDGERCSEFDPLVNNGSVSPSELDHLVKVSRNLQSSPGVENTIMSLAKYSYFNDVETSFWYDNEGQNTFNYGTRTDVKPLGGHGNYFHFHTWRSVNSWAYEGLSYVITSDGKVEGDIPWANQYEKSTMGLEVRSGKLFYYSPKLNKNYQYIIGRYPTWDIDAYQNVQDFDRSLFPQKN